MLFMQRSQAETEDNGEPEYEPDGEPEGTPEGEPDEEPYPEGQSGASCLKSKADYLNVPFLSPVFLATFGTPCSATSN